MHKPHNSSYRSFACNVRNGHHLLKSITYVKIEAISHRMPNIFSARTTLLFLFVRHLMHISLNTTCTVYAYLIIIAIAAFKMQKSCNFTYLIWCECIYHISGVTWFMRIEYCMKQYKVTCKRRLSRFNLRNVVMHKPNKCTWQFHALANNYTCLVYA